MANGDKVCKNGKKSGGFLFQSYIKCVISEICFALVKSYSISRTFAAHNEKGFVAASVF